MNLDLVKKHLRVDAAHDDDLIQVYIDTSTEFVASYLDKVIYDDQAAFDAAEATSSDGVIRNNKIDVTIMQLVGHLYEFREMLDGTGYELCDQLLITDRKVVL